MSHQKVLELAKKFAEKSLNEQYQQQRDRLEEFAYDFTDKLRAILNEMTGDLATLREKGYDKTYWKQLANLYQRLIDMRKEFDYHRPYVSAEKIYNFIFSKDMFLIIQTLHSSIQKYLKENEVDFRPSGGLKQARVDSLRKLITLMHDANSYMKKNPMLPDAREMPTVPPPPKVPADPEYKPLGGEAVTRVDKTK